MYTFLTTHCDFCPIKRLKTDTKYPDKFEYIAQLTDVKHDLQITSNNLKRKDLAQKETTFDTH